MRVDESSRSREAALALAVMRAVEQPREAAEVHALVSSWRGVRGLRGAFDRLLGRSDTCCRYVRLYIYLMRGVRMGQA